MRLRSEKVFRFAGAVQDAVDLNPFVDGAVVDHIGPALPGMCVGPWPSLLAGRSLAVPSMGASKELVQVPLGNFSTVRRIEALLKLLAKPLLVELRGPRLLNDEVHLARLVVLDAHESAGVVGDAERGHAVLARAEQLARTAKGEVDLEPGGRKAAASCPTI